MKFRLRWGVHPIRKNLGLGERVVGLLDKENGAESSGHAIDGLFKMEPESLVRLFKHFAQDTGMDINDVSYSWDSLQGVVDRVQDRVMFYETLYEGSISHSEVVCAYCFWILKLSPFFHVKLPDYKINSVFAVNIFLDMIKVAVEASADKKKDFRQRYVDRLVYAFTYEELSIDALHAIAGALWEPFNNLEKLDETHK